MMLLWTSMYQIFAQAWYFTSSAPAYAISAKNPRRDYPVVTCIGQAVAWDGTDQKLYQFEVSLMLKAV